jgi:hypothetical protein
MIQPTATPTNIVYKPTEMGPPPDLPPGTSLPNIVYSPLICIASQGDLEVAIVIYRYADAEEWILEVQDDHDGATLWDDRFPTDAAALAEAKREIDERDVAAFVETWKI